MKAEELKQKLTNPQTWPEYPLLAIKREVKDPKKKRPIEQFGTMICVDKNVYLEVLLAPVTTVVRLSKIPEQFKQIEVVRYNTIEDLAKAGWSA